MTASKAAFAAKIESRSLSARRTVGVVFACVFAASCSASGGDTAYDLLANGEDTATLQNSAETAVLPSFRPSDRLEVTSTQKEEEAAQSEMPQTVVAAAEIDATTGATAQEQSGHHSTEREPTGDEDTGARAEVPSSDGAASAQVESQEAPSAEADSAAAAPEQDMAESVGDDSPATSKRSLLSAFFAPSKKNTPFPETSAPSRVEEEKADSDAEKPVVTLASASSPATASLAGGYALPGVRGSDQLFDISSKSGVHDEDSLDLYEAADESYQVAYAAGLARLAPNGLIRQREDVDVSCFKPELVRLLKNIERRFGKRIMVTSGYRSPAHNKRVRGARKSMHMQCAAADIQIEGVGKWELARYVRSLPGRGGVGTYCHTKSVHVDVGPHRDWNWNCRR